MLFKVRGTISRYNMLKERDRVLVALSGGPDSVCLLYILKKLTTEYNLRLSIAHLNHGMRGRESDTDQKFCEELGKKMDIPVFSKKVRIRKSEDAARNARYKFLEDTARRIGATKIALGHNADDQVETVLMRLLRGAGTRGMAGIPPVRHLGNVFIIRPLINVWREEILDYLKKRNFPYRVDSTNKELNFFRNRIRHELIPFLSKYNPDVKNILLNTGRNMEIVNKYFEDIVEKEFKSCNISREEVSVNTEKLKNLPLAISQRFIRKIAGYVEPRLNLESIQVDNILSLASEKKGSKTLVLPKGVKVIREYGKLIFCRAEKQREKFEVELPIPGRIKIPRYKILISSELCNKIGRIKYIRPIKRGGCILLRKEFIALTSPPHKEGRGIPRAVIKRNSFKVNLDYDSIQRPLIIRNRRPGDVFQPIGLKGKKKVKDIFIDKKVPKRYRDIIPMFVSGKDICWIPGYRIGEKFKVKPNTTRVVKISVRGVEKLWQTQVQE